MSGAQREAGRRLFPESGIATGLALASGRTTGSGVMISVYNTAGRLEFGEAPNVTQ